MWAKERSYERDTSYVRYKDFVSIEEFQGMRQLGKSSQNVEINLRGVGCENMKRIASARVWRRVSV
jgi:hypothetical protein